MTESAPSFQPRLGILRLGTFPELEMELCLSVDGVDGADDVGCLDLVTFLHGNALHLAV